MHNTAMPDLHALRRARRRQRHAGDLRRRREVVGSVDEFTAGDVMLLPPGHADWCVGDVDCTFVEFSQGNDYYGV